MEGTLNGASKVSAGSSILFYQDATELYFNSADYAEVKSYTPVLDGDYRVSFSFYTNTYTKKAYGALRHVRNGVAIYQSSDYYTTDVSSGVKTITVDLLGVKKGDTKEDADYFIKKIPPLRICEDENGKINKSIVDTNGEILLVSQFTLFANTSHGNRPDFLDAEAPQKANELYEYVVEGLIKQGLTVKKGVFGADMKINQTNDGPFTVVMEK